MAMATFVLVPGFWLGAWAWRRVAAALRSSGHDVYAVSPTGQADRRHLGGPAVDLETHTTDLLNLLRYEDLHDVVLVGHSGAGGPVTQVLDRAPGRLAQVVYVDSAPLPDGMAQADFEGPDARRATERRVLDGWRLPMPSWEELDQSNMLDGLDRADRELIRARRTDQPAQTALQPLRLTDRDARASMDKVAVCCTFTAEQMQALVDGGGPQFAELALPGWRFVDLPTGHWPMFSAPKELGLLLEDLAPA
jgi:pimeloyl-ACP methyl ester carboxylesterase